MIYEKIENRCSRDFKSLSKLFAIEFLIYKSLFEKSLLRLNISNLVTRNVIYIILIYISVA